MQRLKRQPLNRVVETSALPQRVVEVYHADDRGDWRFLVFRLPRGISELSKEHAYRQLGEAWVQKCMKFGLQINRKSITPLLGPKPCLELENLDMDEYAIGARFSLEKPALVTPETAMAYLENQPVEPSSPLEINDQALRAPALIETNARRQREAAKKVRATQEAHREIAKIRREKGLPAFKEETVLAKHGLKGDDNGRQ